MRSNIKTIASLLGAALLLSLSSCDKVSENTTTSVFDTIESTTTETIQPSEDIETMPSENTQSSEDIGTMSSEPTDATTATSYLNPYRGETGLSSYSRNIYGGKLDSLLGYENVHFIGERYSTGNAVIYFYTEDNIEIASQFGPGLYDPWFYNVDLDGDSVDEMICPCVYTGDGCPCVLIYRNNNGVIEVGYPDYSRFEKLAGAELYTLNSYSKYDFETDRIVLYYKKEELAKLTIDDYVFSEYEPEYYFRDNDIWPND
jgi:hypothetical protein